jgi:hypothetical protein
MYVELRKEARNSSDTTFTSPRVLLAVIRMATALVYFVLLYFYFVYFIFVIFRHVYVLKMKCVRVMLTKQCA